MTPHKKTIYILPLIPLLLGCMWFSSEEMPLSYVGEIELLSLENVGDEASFSFKLTGGEWNNNSAKIFKDVKTTIEGNNIYITIRTCVASGNGSSPQYHIKLKKLNVGWYTLYYRNPDKTTIKLTEINVN